MFTCTNYGMSRAGRRVVSSLMLLFAISASPLVAQTPGAAAINKSPVLVLSIASLDGLQNDIGYISNGIGMPQLGTMAQIYMAGFGQGLDRSQPVGVVVQMIDDKPVPMMFAAIADVKGYLKRLEQQIGPADELADGTLVVQVGTNLLYIRDQGEWAFAANNRDALADLPQDPKSVLNELHQSYDIGILANVQQIPQSVRESLVEQMRKAYDRALEQLKEKNGGELQADLNNDVAIKQIERTFRDAEYVTLGVTIDQENNQVALDFVFNAVQGSELAKLCNERQPLRSQFAGLIRPNATSNFHIATTVGKEEQEVVIASLKQSIARSRSLFSQSLDLSKDDSAKIDQYLPRIEASIEAGIRTGKANGGMVVLTENNNLQVLVGCLVAEGKNVEQIIKDLYGEFRDNPDAPQIQFNADTYKGLALHRGSIELQNPNQELSKVFGQSMPLVIATSDTQLYVGVGQGIEALLKETVDISASAAPTELPLAHGVTHLLPALQYADWVAENSRTDLMLKAIQANAKHDQIRYIQKVEPDGQSVRIMADDGVFQVIGALLQASRAPDQF